VVAAGVARMIEREVVHITVPCRFRAAGLRPASDWLAGPFAVASSASSVFANDDEPVN